MDVQTKRSDHRLELNFPVRFFLKDLGARPYEGEAVDFHARGICIMAQQEVPLGAMLDLHLFLPRQEKTIRTSAKVKWAQKVPGVSKNVRLGLQFPRELDVALPITIMQENINQLSCERERRWQFLRQNQTPGPVVRIGEMKEADSQRPSDPVIPYSKPNVLLIDDDENLITNLSSLLANINYTVTVIPSGETALEAIKRNCFQVVLLDLQLPQMSGVEILRAIKEYCPNTEVLIWTDMQVGRNAVDCLNLGASQYLIKPVPFPALHHAIETALARYRRIELTMTTGNYFRTLFNSCCCGMALFSAEGLILEANDCLCRFLGYAKEELLGTSILRLVSSKEERGDLLLRQEFFSTSGQPFTFTRQFLSKDGDFVNLRLSGGWVFNDNALPSSAVALVEKV